MDIAKHNTEMSFLDQENPTTSSLSTDSIDPLKSKSSHRMHYEAHVEVIKKQTGGLSEIRQKLGLSQRKICQLLMVDPSAWTRWTRSEGSAPPHIYRALQWYMIIQEKIPGLTAQYFVGKDPEVLHQTALRKIDDQAGLIRQELRDSIQAQNLALKTENMNLHTKVESLEGAVKAQRFAFFMLAIAAVILGVAFYFKTGRRL